MMGMTRSIYICLCMCVYTMVNVRLRASSEGQRNLIKVLSLSSPIFNVHMAVDFPASLICNFTELPQMRNLNPLKHVT